MVLSRSLVNRRGSGEEEGKGRKGKEEDELR